MSFKVDFPHLSDLLIKKSKRCFSVLSDFLINKSKQFRSILSDLLTKKSERAPSVSSDLSIKKSERPPFVLSDVLIKESKRFRSILSALLIKKSKRLLSIDFGMAFIKIVYLESSDRGLNVLDYDIKKIPFNAENKTEIVSFISGFLRGKFISSKEACLTLSDPDAVVVKRITLPVLPEGETFEAVKWQLSDELPFDINTGIIDWQIVKEYSENTGEKKRDIISVVAKRESVDRCLSVTRDCGLVPFRISSPFFNYQYLLKRLQNNPSVVPILNVGSKESSLSIYKDNQLLFTRVMSFSLDKLASSLTGTLFSGKGKIELSINQAEGILKDFGIPEAGLGILRDNIQASHVISLIRPYLEALIKELRLTFKYFSSNFRESSPLILHIIGEGANLKRLDTYLAEELKFKVFKLSLPECINTEVIEKERFEVDRNQLMSAIGAGLAGKEAINLFPLEVKTKKIELVQKIFLRTFAIVVAAIFLVSLFMLNIETLNCKSRLDRARGQLQSIQQIKFLKESVDLKEHLINRLRKGKVPDHVLLKVLSGTIHEGVVLDKLTFDMSQHTVLLKGKVLAGANVIGTLIKLMKEIKDSPFFLDVSLINSENKDGEQVFEIECSLAK